MWNRPVADDQALPPEIAAPIARFHGERPPAPAWFDQALAHEPERSVIEVEGAPIELLTWGEVGRPGLVFLHGNGAHADWWRFIAPFFAADHRCAAISWSGMGGSGWREVYSPELYAAEVFAAAKAASIDDPLLVAHSFGGFPAMYCAAAHAERLRGAIYVDTSIRPPHRRWAGPPERGRGRVYPTLPEALARFRFAPPQPCENLYIADFIARTSLKAVDGGWAWKFDPLMWSKFERRDFHEVMAEVRAPSALIWGGRSSLMDEETVDYMLGQMPAGMPTVVIPEADHHVMVDQPLAFVAALRGLLAAWP